MEPGNHAPGKHFGLFAEGNDCSSEFVEADVRFSCFDGQDETNNHVEEVRKETNLETDSSKRPVDFVEEVYECCPYVGLEFETDEEAYNYYNRYAGRVGFSVRKYSKCNSHRTGDAIGRIFCCSLEGARDARSKPAEERKRNRADTRTGCRARITIRRKGDKWVVTGFSEEHNHNLVPPSKRHKLRSLRKMTEDIVMNYMDMKDGEGNNMALTLRDARNFLSTKRQGDVRKGDAEDILYYLERQQVTNPSFFYAIQVDLDGLMTNFFWADARSRMDYHYFGDVVCFDTTFGKTRFGIPFVPILGVNHHCQTVLFGGALLFNESEESLTWLVKTWMNAMNGKEPKLIYIDQDSAIGEVVQGELMGTHQRYCLWNIMRSAKQYLQNIITSHKGFTEDFSRCLFSSENVKEFECNWATMIGKYSLSDNNWLMQLYDRREKWALVYACDIFSASMYTTQPNENAYFDRYLRRDLPLDEFLKQFERAVIDRRVAENDMDFESNKMPVLKLTAEIEKEAASLYTKAIFLKFQDQLLESLSYRHKRTVGTETKSTYNVWKTGHEQASLTVTFDSCGNYAHCSCQLFEYSGYLCRHILKIFLVEDVQNLPPQYILKRWTKDAKSGPVVDVQGSFLQTDYHEAAMVRYQKLCLEAVNVAIKGSSSIEVYKVAMQGLRNTLKEVEAALRNVPNNSMGFAGLL